MPVLTTPPVLQFFDDNGDPLAGGTVLTRAAGTTTNKVTYTAADGMVFAPNPIQLNASGIPESGNGGIWIQGSYDFYIYDSAGTLVGFQPNVTSFNNTSASVTPFSQDFSGNGSSTSFTLSQDLGTDPKSLMVFVASPDTGFFQQFSGTGAQTAFTLSKNMGTDSSSIQVLIYNAALGDKFGYDIVSPSTYTVNGTSLTFTVAPVTGTNNIYVSQPTRQDITGIAGYISPSLYTLSGTNLTFLSPPAAGTNNIHVTAPSTLAGAAAASATAADASATAAANSAVAASASAANAAAFATSKLNWAFSSSTSMTDPGTANLRLNNSTLSAVNRIAISNLSANAGNPDLSGWTSTWDDAPANPRGALYIFKDTQNFAIYTITGANQDNTGWKQLTVGFLASSGSFTNLDNLSLGFAAYGATTVTGGITALTGDVTASGSGSVAATIAANAVTNTKLADMAALTIKSNITGGTADPSDNSLSAILDASVTNTQGSILYRNASSWVSLPPGTNGQLLTSAGAGANPSWTTVSSGGSYTLLATRTASASANLDFLSVLTSAYDAYVFQFVDLTVSANSNTVSMQFSINNSTFITTNYAWTAFNGTTLGSTTPVASVAGSSSTSISLSASNMTTGAAEGASGYIMLLNANSTTCKKRVRGEIAYGSATEAFSCWGNNTTLSAVNAVRFLPASGNFATGKILCYGIKNT